MHKSIEKSWTVCDLRVLSYCRWLKRFQLSSCIVETYFPMDEKRRSETTDQRSTSKHYLHSKLILTSSTVRISVLLVPDWGGVMLPHPSPHRSKASHIRVQAKRASNYLSALRA